MDLRREAAILEKGLEDCYLKIFRESGAFIAGGAVASVLSSSRINDYDIYFPTIKAFEDCHKEFKSLSEKKENDLHLVFKTGNAYTYEIGHSKTRMQLIQAFIGSPEEIFDKFDFSCCMGAYHFMSKEFRLHPNFLTHLAQRRLVFNTKTPYPLSSLVRVRKYIQKKGFSIDAIQLVKMALTIHSIDLSNYQVLKQQLQGVDIMLFKQLLDKLEEKKNEPYEFEEFVTWIENLYNNLEEE